VDKGFHRKAGSFPAVDSECLIFIALVGSAVLIVAVLTVVVVWPALAPWL
jgi:hypothetical protein